MNASRVSLQLVILLCLLAVVPVAEGQLLGFPAEIAGYRVFATYNSEDVACMPPNTTRVVLQTTQPTVEAFLAEVDYAAVSSALQWIQTSRRLQVGFVGPTADPLQSSRRKYEWNQIFSNRPCITLRPPQEGADGDEIASPPGYTSYAIVENTDAASLTDDIGQIVWMRGPSGLGDPGAPVAFLNNVWTDYGYFLQTGFVFEDFGGKVVWTTDAEELHPIEFDLTYHGLNEYIFHIVYDEATPTWWLCANEITVGYDCEADPFAIGTTMAGNINTSVFVENQSSDPYWYISFSNSWRARQAKIVIPPDDFTEWSSQHLHMAHACSVSYPPSNAMSGSLTGYSELIFDITEIPPVCS